MTKKWQTDFRQKNLILLNLVKDAPNDIINHYIIIIKNNIIKENYVKIIKENGYPLYPLQSKITLCNFQNVLLETTNYIHLDYL